MGRQLRRQFPILCLFCCLLLGLPNAWAEVAATVAPVTAPAPAVVPLPTYTNEELLTQMLVVDVSERTLDAIPALAITFSQDIKPTADFTSFITLTAGGKAVEGAWVLASEPRRLYFSNIQPQTAYRVQVRPGVAGKNGLQLQKPVDASVTTRDVQPAFDFATRGSILPAKLTTGLPIRVVNVPELDMEFLRVQPDKLPEVLKALSLGGGLKHWQLEEIHAVTESVFSRRYVTDAKQNARTNVVIPVENIPELQMPGLYFAVMRQPGRFGDDAYRITPFVVTNIGLHVRLYARGVEVFASALDTGKPLANVRLKLQGEKEPLELVTDEQGHASFKHRPDGDLLLMADLDQQFTFLDLREAALDLSEYAVTGAVDQPIAPFVYSSRDLFRPGETMDLSVLLRDRDGRSVSVDNLNLRIVRPDTKLLLEENLTASNSKLGFFAYHLPIPADAPTGAWKAEVRINAKDVSPVTSFTFHVEDFMPERMKLVLDTEDKLLTLGKKLVVAVQGDYLYGAPAAGNKLTSVRTIAVNRHPLPAFKDYFFGDNADDKLIGREDLPELQLNEKGGAFLEVPAPVGKINSPLTLSVIGSLHEAGGRTVTRKLDAPFWPTQNLVGIRPLFAKDTVDGNTEASFELVRVTAEGKPAVGQPLAATLVREEKDYFWEYNDSEGWQRKDVSSKYPTVQKKITLDAKGHGNVAFPVQYGAYRLEVEDAETGLKSVYPFHAGWDWEQEGSAAARPDQISLSLDKVSYRVGDIAKLKITPPSAGEALVAVEGDSLLWSQRVSLPAGGMTLNIPVDEAWNRHDLYITVTAFRPASSQQKIAPNRALGVIFLPLDRSDRKLNLAIEAADKVLPEQTVSVTVASDNLSGQSAVVTLAAVDVGVLNITDFKTPDPFAFYFAQHAYGVNLHDAYGKIIESVDGTPLRQRFGGDAGSRRGGLLPQAGMRIVSLFSGAVQFNSEGKAKIDLAIPGFDGTLRLMAVAASSERFGSAEMEMKVASPVVASMAAPRFLAAGDSGFLTLNLNNTTDTTQIVKFKLEADTGLSFMPTIQEKTLVKGERKTFQFPLAAKGMLGIGNVNLELTGKNFTAHRQVSVAVRPAYPAKHTSISSELKAGEKLTLGAATLQGFMPEGLKINVSLSASPALPMRSALQGLLQYPYGCLEQTTSSAWPYLFLESGVAEHLGLEPLPMAERNARVSAALLRLAGMQLSSGGFTLWGSDGEEEYWLSPYVTDFLLDAKAQGFVVPEWLLQRALKNLGERLQENERYIDSRYEFSEMPEHLDLATRAYAAYVLSRAKQAPLGTLRVMYDKDAGKAASGLPLVHLGLALNAMGDIKRGNEAIQKGLGITRDDKSYMGDYGSQLRDEAAIIYLLLRNKVAIPGQAARIKRLADLLHNRTYFSTQEQLFTFLAGLKVQEKAKEGWAAKLAMVGGSVGLSGTGTGSRVLSAADLQSGVSITAEGNHPLFVDVALDGYPEVAPVLDVDPIEVKRAWYDMKGKQVQSQDIKAGDLLLTHLQVISQIAINDALVIDLVPAGFEVENTNLSNNESLQSLQLEGMDKPVTELLDSSTLRTQEFRDDRYIAALPLEAKTRHHLFYMVRVVSTGNFVVPPPIVEDMYRPALNGVGAAAGTLSIKP
jgi:hypothetical protein